MILCMRLALSDQASLEQAALITLAHGLRATALAVRD
jgi:hypothetical protein